ncbi:MAG TPA: vWA domain-containing protein [Trichormus sp.]
MRKAIFAILSLLLLLAFIPAYAEEERPTNFVFLLDVSGSMLYKSEMVPAAGGQKVFLFEALRQALAQIVQDPRLIGPKSKACIITFGTQVAEKTDWPQQLPTAPDREKLVQLIQSPEALQADKHGDTYMGAAIAMALDKANKMYAGSDPCTTTYIVMLTDGWDEPPPGGSVKARDAAAKFVARSKEIQHKLGVKTWQALVIGLQNLPDRKAGTTTAKELAGLLDGEFIDVTKEAGGTVSEKIFSALKKTVESLKGEITVAQDGSQMVHNELQFGTINGNGAATAAFPVELKSCYAEEILGVHDLRQPSTKGPRSMSRVENGKQYTSTFDLPAGALTVSLDKPNYTVAPEFDDQGDRKTVTVPVTVVAQAHSNCPPGNYTGMIAIDASARVTRGVTYTISVPGRIVTEQDTLKVLAKKPGMFWAEPTECALESSLKDTSAAHGHAVSTVTITPESARLLGAESSSKSGKTEAVAEATIDAKQINDGKPLTVSLNPGQATQQPFRLNVFIPAHQMPGKYRGKMAVSITGSAEMIGPSEIPYEIVVEPSPWEKVAPIAIPVFLLCIITCVLWIFFWLQTMRR